MCRTLYQVFSISHSPGGPEEVISRIVVPIDAVLLDDPRKTLEHLDFMLHKYYPRLSGKRKEWR